ncbi:hypothetical protein ILYODFUR_037464 [Ilyodon furcidens]|uniref:Uncharacterized protein n=1 Tax=Ilyodon furcidens TaxID=33524 RepID=A0ABV0TEB1_9TELE
MARQNDDLFKSKQRLNSQVGRQDENREFRSPGLTEHKKRRELGTGKVTQQTSLEHKNQTNSYTEREQRRVIKKQGTGVARRQKGQVETINDKEKHRPKQNNRLR